MKKILLPEIVSAGLYNAQAVFKSRSVSPNRKTTMFEIELPIGDGGTSYINDTSHAISENLIILAKPGQIRHTRLPFKCYYVHMIIGEGQIADILSSLPSYIDVSDTSEIKELYLSLIESFESTRPEDAVLCESLALKLIYLLSTIAPRESLKSKPKSNNRRVIESAIRYVNDNLTKELTLEKISAMFSYTPVYFHKLFKASCGKNLREYVEEQRIKRGVELMLSTEMTLTEIAYECGFSSQSYFSYAFKKRMGYPPREYAKNILLKYEK